MLSNGASRFDSVVRATGEEVQLQSLIVSNDEDEPKPTGRSYSDSYSDPNRKGECNLCLRKLHTIGTWNVRSMNIGKLEIVKNEMERNNLDILGISEMRWTDRGHFNSGNHTIYFSGSDQRRNGVAFIINKKLSKYVLGYNPVNDRIITIKLQGKPTNITIIQVYAPTLDSDEDVKEQFYSELENTISKISKKDILIIVGDWNSKVGDKKFLNITGQYGLGDKNDAGDKLLEFCSENEMSIANTLFKQPKRRLYTWTSPDQRYRNQIDYIIIQNRWRSMIHLAKTLPGADCGSDHELLIAKIKIKLRKAKQIKTDIRYDLSNISDNYTVAVSNRFEILENENISEKAPNELWEEIKETILSEAENLILKKKVVKRSKWLSEETIKTAEKRKLAKCNKKWDEFKTLNAEFQRQARKDKESFIIKECEKVEDNMKKGKTKEVYKTIKNFTRQFSPKVGVIKDEQGNNLTEERDIKNRWKEYVENLYKKNNQIKDNFIKSLTLENEPNILEEEVRLALKKLANNKSPGVDNIPIELVKIAGENGIKIITTLCRKIWDTGEWPTDWKRSIYIPLPKKGDTRICSNNRTIALISHTSKILLKIIQKRIEPYMEREIANEQAGFRKGRGTRDHINNIRWIQEKCHEFGQPLYLCFIDYSKAFDCVDHEKLWLALREIGIPEHLINILCSLYNRQEATVRTEKGNTEWFNIGKGVRQGCILSPYLFNMYTEIIMRKALDSTETGIKIGGQVSDNMRYADDTTLVEDTEHGMKNLIKRVKDESEKAGLYLNIKKTKLMTTDNITEFKIDDEYIEIVESFIFLGSQITRNGGSDSEIRRRIGLTRTTMKKLAHVIKNNDLTLKTKIRLVNTLIFSVFLYGCESWTIRKKERKKIDALELWCWRKLLKISWIDKITNANVLAQIQPVISLEGKINNQKLSYFGHIMRSKDSLEKSILVGKCEGKRKRGRQRMRWLDNLKEVTGKDLIELKELVQDRSKWRSFVQEITRSRKRLDGT